jgi:hypothetical protein
MIPDLATRSYRRHKRRGLRFVCLAAIWLALLARPADAELSWDTLAVDRLAELGAPSIDVTFRFKNSGDAPVTITSVRTSCGCTSANLTKKDYAPGESGELKVTYRFAGQVGAQEKTISVTTSDAPDRPTILALRVQIPELVTVSPRMLWWSVGEAATEKRATITVNPAVKAEVTSEPPDNVTVTARLVAQPDGHAYVLSMRPGSTRDVLRVRVDIHIVAPGLEPQTVAVYALVR